eukprot:1035906-Rhodomonas_salina.1
MCPVLSQAMLLRAIRYRSWLCCYAGGRHGRRYCGECSIETTSTFKAYGPTPKPRCVGPVTDLGDAPTSSTGTDVLYCYSVPGTDVLYCRLSTRTRLGRYYRHTRPTVTVLPACLTPP